MRSSMNSLPDSCWALRGSDEFSACSAPRARPGPGTRARDPGPGRARARALSFGRQTSKKPRPGKD